MRRRVRLLGRPRVEGRGAPCPQPRGLKSWALLARVAMAERPVARHELARELFADADDPLGALRWSLSDLRRSLGAPSALRGDPPTLGPRDVWVDVWALEDGSLPAAEIGGELLGGVELRDSPGFGTWLLLARARCAARSMEELRRHVLDLLAAGDPVAGAEPAGRAANLDPLDEDAQELLLRTLVAAGREAQASMHLAACESLFAREGLVPSPALRAAARGRGPQQRTGVRAGVVAASLMHAGSAAIDAGAPDAGIETLRRAADEARRARNPTLAADVLRALGSALVHAVRGFDGEGVLVLHEALTAARAAERADLAAEVLRELAFVDVQAGRHSSAGRLLVEAEQEASAVGDDALLARILGVRGMNEADRGRHLTAAALLTRSVEAARGAGQPRQESWSLGLLARSLLLSGQVEPALSSADGAIALAQQERWNAYLPWAQVMRAQALGEAGEWQAAREDAESAFALACELGDPCWEGMAGRALGLIALEAGAQAAARAWIVDARRRSDRVPDRYVWVSAYVGLAELQVAVREGAASAAQAAARLRDDAVQADLPEFLAWALLHQAEAGATGLISLARTVADGVTNPGLHERLRAFGP